jgi:hypothetical protein
LTSCAAASYRSRSTTPKSGAGSRLISHQQARTLDEKNAALQDLLGHADTHGPLIDEVTKYQAEHGNFTKPPAVAAVTSDDKPPTAPTKRRSSRTREPEQ